MYCSNQSSMATLLQQKSFMKNLTNGSNVVVVNGTDDSSSSIQTGTTTAATNPTATSRMLLPHETVTVLSPVTGSATLIHQQPLIHQQTTAPVVTTTAASFNSQFINHLQSNHHLSSLGVTAAPTTSFQSQFHNAYVDVNSIFNRSSTVTSISNSSSSPHHHLPPHLVSNASSLVYANGTQPAAAAAASSAVTASKLHHHQQQQQQTVSESQTANHTSATSVAINPERPPGDCPDGLDQKPATATATDEDQDNKDVVDSKDQIVGPADGVVADEEPEPEIDIVINNVVCSFSVRCHLNLRDIAQKGFNVEFRRENGMVTMKLRRPYTTASIWSSGKITCTGATSEDQAKVAARRYSRCLQKLGFNVRFRNFRIVNVLGTCSMPWGIMIVNFSEKYKKDASYEPELHPGVTYKLYNPKATLKIFSTGSITVTAASVAYVQSAIEHIFPLVYEFRKKRTPAEKIEMLKQPPFDPDLLIEEDDGGLDGDVECDITDGASAATLGDLDNTTTKAINQNRRTSSRKCISRYSSTRVGGRRRPAGKADNDPTEDAMYVSDDDEDEEDEDDDMIESD